MNTHTVSTRIFPMALVVLSITVIWSYIQLQSAHAAAQRATEQLAESQELADAITSMRSGPTVVGDQLREQDELTRRIEETARVAGIAPGAPASVAFIEPAPAQRLADSTYLEKPTQVLVTNVTLTELARFLSSLTDEGETLHVKNMFLNVSDHQDATDERWKADLTLTYLIYAPRDESSSR